MERCPGCRARLAGHPLCSRCGCDVTLALSAENHAARLMRRAMHAWAAGNRDAAKADIRQSLALDRKALGEALSECLSRP